ncbi:hypothetical protein Q5752_001969 [Cryptotrichosporon argae]
MAAPTLASFLCFVSIVVGPLHRLGEQYAFLVYTTLLLFFFPRGRLFQQLESNAINFVGAILGLAYTSAVLAVAGWCGTHHGADSNEARGVLAVGLTVLSIICGFGRSYAPQLNVACRAALFYPIFVLTSEQAITNYQAALFLDQFYVVVFAFAFSLVCGIPFAFRSSSPHFGAVLLSTLDTASRLLAASLDTVFEHVDASTPSRSPSAPRQLEEQPVVPVPGDQQQALARKLKTQVGGLRAAHAAYSREVLRAARHPSSLASIVRGLRRLQRNPLLGPAGHVPGERIRVALERSYATPGTATPSRSATPQARTRFASSPTRPGLTASATGLRERLVAAARISTSPVSALALQDRLADVATHKERGRRPVSAHTHSVRLSLMGSCRDLSAAIIAALRGVARELGTTHDWMETKDVAADKEKTEDALVDIRARVQALLGELQNRLRGVVDSSNETPGSKLRIVIDDDATRQVAFDDDVDWLNDGDRFRVAFYMIALIDLAKDATQLIDATIQTTRADDARKHWILPRMKWWEKTAEEVESDQQTWTSVDQQGPPAQADVDDEQGSAHDLDFAHQVLREEPKPYPAVRTMCDRIVIAWRTIWDRHEVVRARVALSHLIHATKHSRHVEFSIKQALGVILLALPAFLSPGSPGRSFFSLIRGQWAVVSFMYVLEVTTGATLRIAFFRTCGTFVGALAAFICVKIAQGNPYALVVLGTACSIPVTYLILFTSIAPFGVVAGLTLSPVMFIPYLGLADGQSDWMIAWTRFVDIVIGIVGAVLVGTGLWPIHARVQYFRAVSGTLKQVTEYYLRMSRDNLRPSLVYQANFKQHTVLEGNVRTNIQRSRAFVQIQKQEISLLPRPIKLYSEIIDLVERLTEVFGEIRTLRFSVPRKATVLDVLSIRRELVSSILVNLWACAQAFHTRSPLPQFLPSCRAPLAELMDVVDEQARLVRLRRRAATQLPAGDGHEHAEEERSEEMAVMYGMAENEALGEVCNIVDELLAAARTLFGTQAFLSPAAYPLNE